MNSTVIATMFGATTFFLAIINAKYGLILLPLVLLMERLFIGTGITGVNVLTLIAIPLCLLMLQTPGAQSRIYINYDLSGAIIAVIIVTTLTAFTPIFNPSPSFKIDHQILELKRWFTYFLLFFIYYKCTKDDRNLITKIVLFIALGYAFESLNSLKEFLIRGRSRLTGSLGNPNELGAYLSIFWVVVWASLSIVQEKLWLKRFLQVILVVGIFCSLRTLSRGSYLTLLATFLVFTFYKSRKTFFLALTASVMIITFYDIVLPDFMVKRINETFEESDSNSYSGEEKKITLQRESAGSRVLFWKTGMLMFTDNPLLGVGFNQFQSWLPVYGAKFGLEIERNSHNMYVKMLSEQGIIGFTIFIFLLIRAYRAGSYLMTSQDILLQRMGVSMCVVVAGFAVSMLFGDRFFQGALVGTFFVLCGIVKAGIYDMSIRKDEKERNGYLQNG